MFSFSVCMIAKNESKNIGKCIDSIMPLVKSFEGSEVIVADTGSTDDTIEIAKNKGAKVYEYKWTGNFAEARNYACSKAMNDYVLSVDCDEFLENFSPELADRFMKDALENEGKIGMSTIVSTYVQNGEELRSRDKIGRFYDRRIYSFFGDVHENLRAVNEKVENSYFDLPISFDHVGYDTPELRKSKAERNKKLLLGELKENPGDPYVLFQLGKCCVAMEEYKEGTDYYEQVMEQKLNPNLSYIQDMMVSYGYGLIAQKRFTDALCLDGVTDLFEENADFMFMLGLIYMNNALFDDAIAAFLKATKTTGYAVEGVNSYKAYYNIGVIEEVRGNILKAKDFYRKCDEYKPAKDRLKELDDNRLQKNFKK